MTTLVDTSALYALADRADANHEAAAAALGDLEPEELITHNYVVVESVALTQRRLGQALASRLILDLLAPIRIRWVDEGLHRAAEIAFLASGARAVSLVDQVSFELIRRDGIECAFAFASDFRRQGFQTIP